MTQAQLLAALAPPLLLVVLLNYRGRAWWTVGLALAAGAASAVAAGAVEHLLTLKPWSVTSLGALMVFTTVVAGAVEELCKYGALRVGPARWMREEYDGVLYAATVSLGFAALENIGYVREHGMETAAVRAYTAIPLHAACGVIMGSYMGRERVRVLHGWNSQGLALTGLVWATLLHGLYDAFAFTSTPVTSWAIYTIDAVAVLWAFRLARAARSRSASFGGADIGLPPSTTPTHQTPTAPLPVRDERIAAALGLVPGFGQFYNGQHRKAAVFTLVLAFNIALYAALAAFVHGPGQAVARLAEWGLTLGGGQTEVNALVQQGETLLAVMLGAIGAWSFYSALDAWLTARRTNHLDGVATSYIVHVALLLVIILAPLLGLGGGGGGGTADSGKGDGGSYQITWVDDPKTIDGWNPGSEGRGDGKGEQTQEKRQQPLGEGGRDSVTEPGAEEAGQDSKSQDGDVGMADPTRKNARKKVGARDTASETRRSGDPGKSAEGAVKSYNDYLSSRLHSGPQQLYFESVPPNVWTIVHYRISADGRLSEVRVVDTNGTPEQARLATDAVRSLAPLAPLPSAADGSSPTGIVVTELFWQTGNASMPYGTQAERLSQLPDGRHIDIEN